MHLTFTRTCLSVLSLMSANALADGPTDPGAAPPRTFKFVGNPVGWAQNGAEAIAAVNARCVENQISTNDEALARIDWADRCGYVSKEKWWKFYNNNFDPRTFAPVPRAQLAYPIFTQGPQNTLWIPNLGTCDMPEGVQFFTICEAGCYTGDQQIAFASGSKALRVPIAEAAVSWSNDVATALQSKLRQMPEDSLKIFGLNEGSTFETLTFKPIPIRRFIASARDEANSILEIKTALGGTLKVTPEHPLINAQGLVLKASFFKLGDELVRQDGTLDAIVSIAQKVEFGKVYNVEPSSSKGTEHIHIAQGFLAGSLALQNGEITVFQRIMSRKASNFVSLGLE